MVGENIRKIREFKNIGLNETARKAGITGGYLSSIERGEKTNTSIETLNSIAIALDVCVDELVKADCSLPKVSLEMNIDEGISYYKNLLKMGSTSENSILYNNTINWLNELNKLREFKNKILSAIDK